LFKSEAGLVDLSLDLWLKEELAEQPSLMIIGVFDDCLIHHRQGQLCGHRLALWIKGLQAQLDPPSQRVELGLGAELDLKLASPLAIDQALSQRKPLSREKGNAEGT